jgi:hypothetical protein
MVAFLEFLRIIIYPLAAVLIVLIPWRIMRGMINRWSQQVEQTTEALSITVKGLLALKASLLTTPTTGPAILQGLARKKQPDEVEMPEKPVPTGMSVKQSARGAGLTIDENEEKRK